MLLRSRATARTGTVGDALNSPYAPSSRQAQRRLLRQRRAALTPQARAALTRAVCRHVAATHWLARGRAIGLYAASGTELDTAALHTLAQHRGCRIYLPRISHYRLRQLRFHPDTAPADVPTADVAPAGGAGRSGSAMRRNRHGIAEPAASGDTADLRWLSVLFLPLLGFDASGTRLGSGHGYFDRALQFRRRYPHRHRPLLVGLAFSCQQLPDITRQPHDVPLDAVVTEAGIRFFNPENA